MLQAKNNCQQTSGGFDVEVFAKGTALNLVILIYSYLPTPIHHISNNAGFYTLHLCKDYHNIDKAFRIPFRWLHNLRSFSIFEWEDKSARVMDICPLLCLLY